MFLWLDDFRDPKAHGYSYQTMAVTVYWAKTYDEAIEALSRPGIIQASLDHDLGACEDCRAKGMHIGDMKTPETTFYDSCSHSKTGYDVVCWMEENSVWPQLGVRVHSANPVGRARMQQVIDKHYARE